MAINLPPLFNAQFFDDDGLPLDGGLLYTYISGTTTDQVTYQDEAGTTPNTNPIVLDARGECVLWLDSTLVYTLHLERADLTTVWTRDDVQSTGVGALTQTDLDALTADDIGFTTGTGTTWYSGTDVGAALDSIITRADAIPAASVPIIDAGGYITGTSVEAALQELGQVKTPSQTGNSGAVLTTNGTVTSWLPRLNLWNVTYLSIAQAENDVYNIVAGTIGVYVSCTLAPTAGSNSGSNAAVEVYTGGTKTGTLIIAARNQGNGDDGASSMTDAGSAFIPIANGSTTLKFVKTTGSASPSFVINAVVSMV